MNTNTHSNHSATALLVLASAFLVALATGLDQWASSIVGSVVSAFQQSTGFRPSHAFRHVSLSAETHNYAEILATHKYLKLYFATAAFAALMSVVFIIKEVGKPIWRHHILLVAFLILSLVPMALTTVAYGEAMNRLSTQIICIVILVLLGIFATMELLRVRVQTISGRLMQAIIVAIVVAEGVLIPTYYGVRHFLRA